MPEVSTLFFGKHALKFTSGFALKCPEVYFRILAEAQPGRLAGASHDLSREKRDF
jgi:hypothetical protein